MSELPSYIPPLAPKAAVLDLSGRLDSSALARIEASASKLNYKAKIVLVPNDYKPTPAADLHDLARSIADAWSVQGNRFLIVIDLPHKQIRTIGGEGLKAKGITTEFVQNTLLPNYFYPSMRKGDLPGAIENLMQAVQTKVAQSTRTSITGTTAGVAKPSSSQYQTYETSAPTHAAPQINGLGLWGTVLIFGSILLALVLLMVKFYKDKTKRLRQALNDRLGDLYKRADQLGQASEYMDPTKNKELALKITAFFEKITALNKAEDEVEELTKGNNFGGANRGLVNCLKLADQLILEMDDLLPAVNAITGGVDNTGEAERLILKKKEAAEQSLKMQEKISVPQQQMSGRYYRPTWSNEPQYAPPVYNNGSSLMDVMFLLNQMNMNNRINQMDWQMNHPLYQNQSYDNPGISDAGGSWGSSSSSGNDAGWGDSGGSFDSGSSSDSGGGSDAGGSW